MMNERFSVDRSSGSRNDMEKMPRKKRKSGFIFLMLLMLLAGFAGGRLSAAGIGGGGFDNQKMMDKIKRLEAYINSYYLNEIDTEKMADWTYRGLVSGLEDPYSEYMNEEQYKDMQESDAGEYRGIGIIVSKDPSTSLVVIETVMKDQPAYNAGVENGDLLLSVDGKETAEMSLSETVSLIKKGKSETTRLVLMRDGQTLEKEVKKTNIVVESVSYEMKKGKTGYIAVDQFIENTDEDFSEAIDALEKQGMKSLIIDLRDNGGGLVDTCNHMVSRIIPEGDLIVYLKDKNDKKQEFKSDDSRTLSIPIVLLVNGNTASASEILTGCLKDYGLATVVGSKTYGKGVVQDIIPLGDGSALKLTVAGYYTPKGNNIHEKGIEPDVEVPVTDEEWREIRKDPSKDKQLDKALEILSK